MSLANSLAYLEDYLDTFEALPLEVTKQLSQMREMDGKCCELLDKTFTQTPEFLVKQAEMDPIERKKELLKLQKQFKTLIEDHQEKVDLAITTYDLVEKHIKRLDEDLLKFEEEQMTGPKLVSQKPLSRKFSQPLQRPRRETPKKRKESDNYRESSPATRPRNPAPIDSPPSVAVPLPIPTLSEPITQSPIPKKMNPPRAVVLKKEEKIEEDKVTIDEPSTVELEIDPNEPTYCICNKVSFGEMIACDNDDCAREWFHYECVGLTEPVKGKWFCAECTDILAKNKVGSI